jgi:hypothetical protein
MSSAAGSTRFSDFILSTLLQIKNNGERHFLCSLHATERNRLSVARQQKDGPERSKILQGMGQKRTEW